MLVLFTASLRRAPLLLPPSVLEDEGSHGVLTLALRMMASAPLEPQDHEQSSDRAGFESRPRLLLTTWEWARTFASLNVPSLVKKLGGKKNIFKKTHLQGHGNPMRLHVRDNNICKTQLGKTHRQVAADKTHEDYSKMRSSFHYKNWIFFKEHVFIHYYYIPQFCLL